jgi:hypothetical protein
MREIRPSGSEGGARSIPCPYPYRKGWGRPRPQQRRTQTKPSASLDTSGEVRLAAPGTGALRSHSGFTAWRQGGFKNG